MLVIFLAILGRRTREIPKLGTYVLPRSRRSSCSLRHYCSRVVPGDCSFENFVFLMVVREQRLGLKSYNDKEVLTSLLVSLIFPPSILLPLFFPFPLSYFPSFVFAASLS